MDTTELYHVIAYGLWVSGGILLIISLILFFRLQIPGVLKGIFKGNTIKLPKYNPNVIPAGEETRPLETDVTETLMGETELLMDKQFNIIYELIEIHTNKIIN